MNAAQFVRNWNGLNAGRQACEKAMALIPLQEFVAARNASSSLTQLAILFALCVHFAAFGQQMRRMEPINQYPPTNVAGSCGTLVRPAGSVSSSTATYSAQMGVSVGGVVESITIYRTTGDADLDAASLAAIRMCKFLPGIRDGKPTESTALAQINWSSESPPSVAFVDLYARWHPR
ncbi:energy transducer TonB [Variovorax sp. RHLX14]|uniref:energy transducer TonB n=1 Tax=unclassified Variovorax TaxID=663243 RepID=UPI003F46FCE0